MNVYKLVYPTKDLAISDLIEKGVYTEMELDSVKTLAYGQGVHAVVEIGIITLTDGTYDEEMVEITPPKMAVGYHYDVMSEQEIVFPNALTVNNPKHQFAGYVTGNAK